MRKIVLISLLFLSGCGSGSLHWGNSLDEQTLVDGWDTYYEFYVYKDALKNPVDKKTFMKRAKHLIFEKVTSQQFLDMNIENCSRLKKYWNAKTAEEAYPEHDRQRGSKDISSVNYFLNTKKTVSPVLVARVIGKGGDDRRIKLDGVHRIMAAHILGKKIKIAWIDLR